MHEYHVYILASFSRRLYVGMTNDLRRRVWEHKSGIIPGFTRDYRITRLVYLERTADVLAAIAREKQLKRWPRWRKDRLIEEQNAGWLDLSIDWFPSRGSPPDRSLTPGE
jgi:putative endonuclease